MQSGKPPRARREARASLCLALMTEYRYVDTIPEQPLILAPFRSSGIPFFRKEGTLNATVSADLLNVLTLVPSRCMGFIAHFLSFSVREG